MDLKLKTIELSLTTIEENVWISLKKIHRCNKYIKLCPLSPITSEVQILLQWDVTISLSEQLKLRKKNDAIKCSKGGRKKISYVLIMELYSSEKWFDSLL